MLSEYIFAKTTEVKLNRFVRIIKMAGSFPV